LNSAPAGFPVIRTDETALAGTAFSLVLVSTAEPDIVWSSKGRRRHDGHTIPGGEDRERLEVVECGFRGGGVVEQVGRRGPPVIIDGIEEITSVGLRISNFLHSSAEHVRTVRPTHTS
jgi:hypothetical protein